MQAIGADLQLPKSANQGREGKKQRAAVLAAQGQKDRPNLELGRENTRAEYCGMAVQGSLQTLKPTVHANPTAHCGKGAC